MHKLLVRWSLAAVSMLPALVSAQDYRTQEYHGGCGTVVTQEHLDRMDAWKKSGHPVSRAVQKSTETLLYPIQHHIVTRDDGTGGISEDDINTAMERNNAFFMTGNIQFYNCGPFNEIRSTEWYDFVSSEEGAMTAGNQVDGVINMYWVGQISGGSVCGYAYFPGGPDVVLMANPCYDGVTLEHELGHFFNLYHTHGKSSGGGFTDELVDGSNCATAGDDICDTPADPDLTGRVNFSTCEYAPGSPEPRDNNGQPFDPDPSNIMAYTYDKCQTRFTNGQWDRIAAATEHPSRTNYECTNPPCVLRNFTTTDESAYGAFDGEIDMEILGSTGPYTIIWTGPNGFTANTEDISGLTAGWYYLDITDVTGCNQIDSVEIFFKGCAPDETRALVTINSGSYADEISWEIYNSTNTLVASGSGYQDNDVRVDTVCLTYGETFTFYAYDEYGDGWSGATYEVRCGGTTILANNNGQVPNNFNNTNDFEVESQEEFVNDICSPIDMRVIEILSPESTCNLTDKERVRVRVMNYGAMPIENFDLALGVNGVAPTVEAVSQKVNSYKTFDYSFDKRADLDSIRIHTLLADVNALGDLNTGNDATTKLVEKEPIGIGNYPYELDFETGLGELIQMQNDDLDWTANSGSTPSNLTGPSSDHTTELSGGNGTYYYVEAGDLTSPNSGQVAVLQSPCVDLTFTSGPYISFYYHMFGSTQGKLALEVNVGAQGWIEVWANQGSSGNSWELADVELTDFVGLPVKFRFVGTVGNGYFSDIAIDDIKIRNETLPLSANIVSADNISCNGLADGYATVNVYGGTPPYTYAWSTGGTEPTEENLAPGAHSVTITDFANVTVTVDITLTEPSPLFLGIENVEDILCGGDKTGEICVLGSGGTPPYTYSIDSVNYQSSGCFTKLAAGEYYVNVKDKNGCITIDTIEVVEPPVFAVNLDSTDMVACWGDSSGFAAVSVTGGVPPYSYNWNNGAVDSVVNNLTGGTNYVIVSDANGCLKSVTFVTPEAPRLRALEGNSIPVICPGDSTGVAVVDVSGGTPPYTVEWVNTGTFGTSNPNVPAGVYTAIVTDSLGCQTMTEVTVEEPLAMVLNKSEVQTTCFGCTNGEAAVSVNNGTPPYTYSWSSGGTDSVETGLAAGTYYITVTDSNDCSVLDSVIITEPEQLQLLVVMVKDVACYGDDDGRAVVEAIGGIPPYTYSWDNGIFGPQIDDVTAGVYTVTVTDSKGNITTLPVVVDEADEMIVTVYTQDDATGACQGGALVVVDGGTPPYTFYWNNDPNPASDSIFPGLCADQYNLVVQDANFCFHGEVVTIYNTFGVEEVEVNNMKVYPNPANDWVRVQVEGITEGQLRVVNLLGEVVLEQVANFKGNTMSLDISFLPEGVYTIQVFTNDQVLESKVVKQ